MRTFLATRWARLRGHPSPLALGAFFDGEDADGVAGHLEDCRRCQDHLHDLGRVRAAVRGEPIPAPRVSERVSVRVRWNSRPVLAPVALGLAMIVAALSVGPVRKPFVDAGRSILNIGPEQKTPSGAQQTAEKRKPKSVTTTVPSETTTSVTAPGVDANQRVPGVAPAVTSTTIASLPAYRLGVVVNTSGPFAKEGVDVVRAVNAVIQSANEHGGVAGRKVQMVFANAEDKSAVAKLPSRVDVMVGGFGVTANAKLPWLFPADPRASGPSVVAAELDPRSAGARLGQDLVARKLDGQVGVVKGDGPDTALGDGLAEVVRTTSVSAGTNTNCDKEISQLRTSDPAPTALAIAGAPELAARCTEAAAKAGWSPAGGVLVAPSAAYWRIDVVPGAQGARTVLGMAWPKSDSAGVARFRAAVPNSLSYRALVSFAAAELAVQIGQQTGGRSVSIPTIAAGTWHSDLFDLQGTTNRSVTVVGLGLEGWAPAAAPETSSTTTTTAKPQSASPQPRPEPVA